MTSVAEEARRWIGTPYVQGASVRGGGTDCLGLLRGVWRAVVGAEPVAVPAYAPDWVDHGGAAALRDGLAQALRPVPLGRAWRPGEVVVFRLRPDGPAKHVGVVVETVPHVRFVHAYAGRGVVESSLSIPWARRVAARYDFPLEG